MLSARGATQIRASLFFDSWSPGWPSEVQAGDEVLSTYGTLSRCASLLPFGFATAAQRATVACRFSVDPADPHASAKRAVLRSAGVENRMSFELPQYYISDLPEKSKVLSPSQEPANLSSELLQTLRLLALPAAQAARLLDGARSATRAEHRGFGEPPRLS